MKKFYYLLIILSTLLFSSSFVVAYADDDDGEEIDVTVLLPDQSVGRTMNAVPIHAIYYSSLCSVYVTFSNNIGNVSIRITNMTTGDSDVLYCDSNIGSVMAPIYFGIGHYCIEFISSAGGSFIGFFYSL